MAAMKDGSGLPSDSKYPAMGMTTCCTAGLALIRSRQASSWGVAPVMPALMRAPKSSAM